MNIQQLNAPLRVHWVVCWLGLDKQVKELSELVIAVLRSVFTPYGLPEQVVSDNGPRLHCRNQQIVWNSAVGAGLVAQAMA